MSETLFNLGHLYIRNNKFEDAMRAWIRAYKIASSIGLTRILEMLNDLALLLGIPEGLDGWEALLKSGKYS